MGWPYETGAALTRVRNKWLKCAYKCTGRYRACMEEGKKSTNTQVDALQGASSMHGSVLNVLPVLFNGCVVEYQCATLPQDY